MKEIITVQARYLVEFIFKKGSINNIFQGISSQVVSRIREGSLIHKKLQDSYKKEEFQREVYLSYEVNYENFIIKVSGRADGIWKNLLGYKIEEIKTTSMPLEFIDEDFYFVHLAQAKVYAFMLLKENHLSKIDIKLTYFNINSEDTRILEFTFSSYELEVFFDDLMEKYFKWVNFSINWDLYRNESLKKIEFPFKEYRKGQRDFAIRVYKAIKDSNNVFCEAPTGIGKTISTIFPSLKAMSEGLCHRIFYLTSKNITSKVAEDALININKSSKSVRFIKIRAKDKICPKKDCTCNPESCPLSIDYFDKINDVLFEIIENNINLTDELIEEYSNKYNICPFELTLDLSNYADFIICDYNYLFDMRVYLRRFFENICEEYVFLIDECHNLIDRTRDMYSSAISKKEVLEASKNSKYFSIKSINMLNKKLIEYRKLCMEDGFFIFKEEENSIYDIVLKVTSQLEESFLNMKTSKEKDFLINFYFNMLNFLRIYEIYDKNYYIIYCSEENDDFIFKLYCIDPSNFIRKCLKRGKSSILFSATLIPIDYHMDLLGKDEKDMLIRIPNPFPYENRRIIICKDIDARFNARNLSIKRISEYINAMANSKLGNYMVFFPSYEYMNTIYDDFISTYSDFKTIIQTQNLGEEEKESFLNFFSPNPDRTHLGFCVLGGMFSEGIDLKGDRLIGAMIVSVGIPKLNIERDLIKDFFQNKNSKGYLYAYMYPGIIKVFQAAGRVIRTMEDKGIIILLDERYSYFNYKKLFLEHLKSFLIIEKSERLKEEIIKFWQN